MGIASVPRMRTIPEAVNLLKELDSSTAITLRAVRRMVNSGELPVTNVGNKRLVNFDLLLERLNNPQSSTQETPKIHQIEERRLRA